MNELQSPATGNRVPHTKPDANDLVERVKAYFASVDAFDVEATLSNMAEDCVLDFKVPGERHEGRDQGVRRHFEQRVAGIAKAWHGNQKHFVDIEEGVVVTHFEVRRTDADGAEWNWDTINLFEFEGPLIKRISVWKGAPRTKE